jgi:hypothetical protein
MLIAWVDGTAGRIWGVRQGAIAAGLGVVLWAATGSALLGLCVIAVGIIWSLYAWFHADQPGLRDHRATDGQSGEDDPRRALDADRQSLD